MNAESLLRDAVATAAIALGAPADFVPSFERPRDPSFGDWSTNAAMILAKQLRRKPLDIAHDLLNGLDVASAGVERASIAGAGFINFAMQAGAEARQPLR